MKKQTFSEEVKIRLQLLMDMEEACFEKDLVKSYSVDSLCRAIQQMKEYQITCNWMFRNIGIQKEIAGNRSFIPWLSSMNLDLRYLKNLDMLLSLCQKEQIEMTQWDAGEVSSLLENNSEVTYSFLRYFYQYRDKECRETILQNIRMILETIEKEPPFDKLTPTELEIICSPYLKYTRLDTEKQFIASIQILNGAEGIQKVFQFLSDNGIEDETFPPNCLQEMKEHGDNMVNLLETILKQLQNEDYFVQFLHQWRGNGTTLTELQKIESRLKLVTDGDYESIFESKRTYTQFLFGGLYESIPMEGLHEEKENILLYAIFHKKKRFIQLVKENWDTFQAIPSTSFLFYSVFYQDLCNLNTINQRQLEECKSISEKSISGKSLRIYREKFAALTPGEYTFDEIKILILRPTNYWKFYNHLRGKIEDYDQRLMVMKQLIKQGVLRGYTPENRALEDLVDKLAQKPLSEWKNKDFAHIKGLTSEDAFRLLNCYEKVKKYLPEIKDSLQAKFLYRNIEKFEDRQDLQDILCHAMDTKSWRVLLGKMEQTDEFEIKYRQSILNFIWRNGADMAVNYLYHLGEDQKTEFLKIVKAECMGQFKQLKFPKGDLSKEIDYLISESVEQAWQDDLPCLKKAEMEIQDSSSFYDTMTLGVEPARTCLSYIDGAYKGCLLSCFDSNKRFLFAQLRGKKVGRAIIRFTKIGSDKKKADLNFCFPDLEADSVSTGSPTTHIDSESLILFLEKPYFSGLTGPQEREVKKWFVEAAENKAKTLGAKVVLSTYYRDVAAMNRYATSLLDIFISNTKGSGEYLDSMGGTSEVNKQGRFYSGRYLLKIDEI